MFLFRVRTVCRSLRTFRTQIISLSQHSVSTSTNTELSTPSVPEVSVAAAQELGYVLREWQRHPVSRSPREAWIESWVDDTPVGILPLNSYVFAHTIDIWMIQYNCKWQDFSKRVNWTFAKNRYEMRGPHNKPWPQKGTGRARAGSIRTHNFIDGGAAFSGPRGPNTWYFKLEEDYKIRGLCSTLSAKFAQDDLKIVSDLNVPSEDPKFFLDLMERRNWGVSALLVDDTDEFPENIVKISDAIDQVNIMPVYGLNIVGMLRHESLVLTKTAAEKIERKLLEKMFSKRKMETNKPIDLDHF